MICHGRDDNYQLLSLQSLAINSQRQYSTKVRQSKFKE